MGPRSSGIDVIYPVGSLIEEGLHNLARGTPTRNIDGWSLFEREMPGRNQIVTVVLTAFLAVGTVSGLHLADAQAAGGKKRPPEAFTHGVENECGYAVLLGFVRNHGLPVDFRFEYGHTKAYGHITEVPEEYAYDAQYPVEVEELIDTRPGRLYHYRLIAITRAGKSYGKDRIFRGAPC